MGERQPHVQRHQPGLGAGAQEGKDQDDGRKSAAAGAHVCERVAARAAGQQAEGQQQRERAEARHQDVDVARAGILGIMMVRHHQRPRRQRHELPGGEKAEGIVGQHNEVHAREEQRIEGQHASGRHLVPAVADGEQAGAGAAQVDHHKEECGECIHAKMRAGPRQSHRQSHGLWPTRVEKQVLTAGGQNAEAGEQADAVGHGRGDARSLNQPTENGCTQQDGDAPQCHPNLHSPPSPGTEPLACAAQ